MLCEHRTASIYSPLDQSVVNTAIILLSRTHLKACCMGLMHYQWKWPQESNRGRYPYPSVLRSSSYSCHVHKVLHTLAIRYYARGDGTQQNSNFILQIPANRCLSLAISATFCYCTADTFCTSSALSKFVNKPLYSLPSIP